MIDLGPYPHLSGADVARRLDEQDPLARFRDGFVVTDPDLIYLDGNSLGRLPVETQGLLRDVVDRQWGADLVTSWGTAWWNLARDAGDRIARIIGAAPGSVVVADSTSVALYKLALGSLRLRPDRPHIVTDALNFPTDGYVLQAAGEAANGRELVSVPANGDCADEDAIAAAIDTDTALLSLSHVAFKSGYLYDMNHLTTVAHGAGAIMLWDLSHSAGVVPMDLSDVDAAVGCTYKYLNGGPGSPAFLYVNPGLEIDNPITGWWGHARPFDFDLAYEPDPSIGRFQTGTMPILSLAAIAPAVDMIADAGVTAIREKSVALTSYLIDLADQMLGPLGFEIATPRLAERRGSHVSIRHRDAWRITQAMVAEGRVIPDFRESDNIRLGLAPLYTRFRDVHTAIHRIAALVTGNHHGRYPTTRAEVT